MNNMIFIIVFLCLSHTSSTENDWINTNYPCISPHMIRDGERWYHFQTFRKMSFFNAYNYCTSLGLRLLSIHTKEEESFIVDRIQHSRFTDENYWTAATCLGALNIFKWMTTGIIIEDKTLSKETPEEPDDEEHNCTVLDHKNDWKLKTADCQKEYYVICENIPCEDDKKHNMFV